MSGRKGLDAGFSGQIFRKDHPIVLACNRHLATIRPVRLAYNADGYPAGQVLARNTSTGYYEKFSAASGSYEAACVLFESLDEGTATSGTALARGIFGGEVFKSKLVDYDSNAKSNLGAREIIDATSSEIVKY